MLILLVVLLGSANCFYVLFRNTARNAENEQLFTADDTFSETFYKTFQVGIGEKAALGVNLFFSPLLLFAVDAGARRRQRVVGRRR